MPNAGGQWVEAVGEAPKETLLLFTKSTHGYVIGKDQSVLFNHRCHMPVSEVGVWIDKSGHQDVFFKLGGTRMYAAATNVMIFTRPKPPSAWAMALALASKR